MAVNADVEICMGHFKWFLKVGGMYVSLKSKRRWRWAQCLYSVFVSSVILGFLTGYSLIFTEEKGLTGSFTVSLAFWLSFAWSAYQVPAIAIAFSKYIDAFVNELSSFYMIYGSAVNLQKTTVLFKRIFIITVLAIFTAFCLMWALHQPLNSSWVNRVYYPFYRLEGFSYVVGILFSTLFHAYINLGLFGPYLFFIALARFLGKEFSHVNQLVKEMVASKTVNEQCESLRKRHILLCGVLETGNKIVTHVIFACFTTQIPVLCFVLFGLIRGTLTLDDTMSSVIVTGVGIVCLVSTLLIGTYISSTAHGCVDDLLRCDLTTLSGTTLHSVNLFTTRLIKPVIGFTVHGLFTVDSSAILTVLGTLLTYAIIVLQLNPDDTRTGLVEGVHSGNQTVP